MDILVTGPTGFVGSHLLKKLPAAANRVFAICRPGTSIKSQPELASLSCDFTEKDFTENTPEKIDAIICLAQSSRWRDFPIGAIDTFDINSRSLLVIADYARRVGAKKIIYVSSGSVYAQSQRAAQETDPIFLNQFNRLYDAAKDFGEVILHQYSNFFPSIILRLFTPYGACMGSQMLFSRLADNIKNGLPIKIQGNDGLRINPIYIEEVIEAILRSLQLDEPATLNVAGPRVYSLRQIGEEIAHVLGKAAHFELDLSVPSPMIVGETKHLKQVLNWQPAIELTEGLEKWLMQSKN